MYYDKKKIRTIDGGEIFVNFSHWHFFKTWQRARNKKVTFKSMNIIESIKICNIGRLKPIKESIAFHDS